MFCLLDEMAEYLSCGNEGYPRGNLLKWLNAYKGEKHLPSGERVLCER